jgi:hypothetical protein
MSDKYNFTDWILEMPLQTFFWGLAGICLCLWTVAIVVLLIYLHFAFPR